MDHDDLIAFARRDWQAVGRGRQMFWNARYRVDHGASARRAATQLLAHAHRLGIDALDDRRRASDLRDHLRLTEQLDRAARAFTGR